MKVAPSFELDWIGGGHASLSELLAQGAVLLVFFKISCPVCQLTLPYLDRLKAGSLRIVAVSQDDAESTAEFHQVFHISLETLLDSEEAGYPASNAYGITHVPSMFLIEQDMTISETINGFVKRDMLSLGKRCGIAPFRQDERVPEWKAG
jgi:peroxiredoxin